MTEQLDIGEFVELTLKNEDGAYYVGAGHWDEIDAAYHQFIERRLDKVLSLITLAGGDLLLPISHVSAVSRSTPEVRAKNARIGAAIKSEQGFVDD